MRLSKRPSRALGYCLNGRELLSVARAALPVAVRKTLWISCTTSFYPF